LRLFSFGGYGLALAALARVVFGAYDSYPFVVTGWVVSLPPDTYGMLDGALCFRDELACRGGARVWPLAGLVPFVRSERVDVPMVQGNFTRLHFA